MTAARGWVGEAARTSDALDLPRGLFTRKARQVALGLKRSARASRRRKGRSELQSAMSMLNYEINRAGRGLPTRRKHELEKAKDELRKLYGRPARGAK